MTTQEKRGSMADGTTWQVINADARSALCALPDCAADCIVTSPPYYWLRDYGVEGQIGHEPSIDEFVSAMRAVFGEAKRVLADDGVMFLNLGDTYYSAKGKSGGRDTKQSSRQFSRTKLRAVDGPGLGIPRKSLIGIPWRVALSLQADGWTLRSAITWERPAPIPESTVEDRPWRSTEQVFLFSKSPRYWFDRSALGGEHEVWRISAQGANPYAHAAPFPREFADRCIRAGCRPGGTVLDPFVGSGTTLLAALDNRRSAIGIDLNAEYAETTSRRAASHMAQPDLLADAG